MCRALHEGWNLYIARGNRCGARMSTKESPQPAQIGDLELEFWLIAVLMPLLLQQS